MAREVVDVPEQQSSLVVYAWDMGRHRRVLLEMQGRKFKCGDIVRVKLGADNEERFLYQKFLVVGYMSDGSYGYYEEDYNLPSDRLVMVGVRMRDKNNSQLKEFIDVDNGFAWLEGGSLVDVPCSAGRDNVECIRANGNVRDFVPEFESTKAFFESIECEVKELNDAELEIFQKFLDLRQVAAMQRVLIYKLAKSAEMSDILHLLSVIDYFFYSSSGFSERALIDLIKLHGFSLRVMRELIAIMNFASKVCAVEKFADQPWYGKRVNIYAREKELNGLAVLDALIESGDKPLLCMMLRSLNVLNFDQHAGGVNWFAFDKMYTPGDVALIERMPNVLYERGFTGSFFEDYEDEKTRRDFYEDPMFFDHPPEFPEVPLSVLNNENSLMIEGATGCPKAAAGSPCKFCTNSLKDAHFKVVPVETFIRRLARMEREMIEKEFNNVSKVFLTGADMLALPVEQVELMVKIVRNTFRRFIKIEGFANVPSVLKHKNKLARLKEAGLTLLYLGGECGDDETLADMGKQQTQADIVKACRVLDEARVDASVFIMPGLGGILRSERIAHANADLIRLAQPKFVNVLPLTNAPKECAEVVEAESGNRIMMPEEIRTEMLQMLTILRDLPDSAWRREVRVASYKPEDVSKVSISPLVFSARFGSKNYSFEEGSEGLDILHRKNV